MEDAKQTPDEPRESAAPKKRWVTPKLSMLDIKVNTLGGLGYLRRERDQDDRRNIFVVETQDGAHFLDDFRSFLGDERASNGHAQQQQREPALAH